MFNKSFFNGDISNWDVSRLNNINAMFNHSKFKGDISEWKPFKLIMLLNVEEIFCGCKAPVPYWAKFQKYQDRLSAINKYILHNELNSDLNKNHNILKKIKI
jgi:hypothetical protein